VTENLWPTDFGTIPQKTPVAILREQAQALGERTGNLVVGRVESEGRGVNKFRHAFSLYCAPLGFVVPLFHVVHEIMLYPVDVYIEGEDPTTHLRAQTPEELTTRLKEIFFREKTKQIIASLIAQSKE
jgi:hypothetical protein